MKRAARFLTGRKAETDGSESIKSEKSQTTCDFTKAHRDLDNGLKGLDRVLDDDMVGAKKLLDQADGPFSKLGRAVMIFLEAALGFESDCVKEAESKLAEAEKACHNERHAVLRANVQFSKLYPPGTEYLLGYAEAHIMSALLLFTSESLVNSIKAAYKLRRCYHILSEIYEIIHQVPTADRVMTHRVTHMTIDEAISDEATCEESGADTPNSTEISLRNQDDNEEGDQGVAAVTNPLFRPLSGKDIGNEFDEYIESGVNVCFGLLQLVLSLMPPTLGKVLSIIGFKGNRREGLDMLWRSSSIMNIHGALALFCLVQYFCGPAQLADIESKRTSAALSVCEKSLTRLKTLYEHSTLWALHEARLYSVQRESKRALEVLKKPYKIQMKAIQGMLFYDRGMAYLDTHEYEKTAESFIQLMKVNSWSLSLYQYIIGSCYVELYRIELRKNQVDKALEYKMKALEYLETAPTTLAARTFMARRMPFDLFVERKIKKWNARLVKVLSVIGDQAGAPELDLVDAVGMSPIQEILYFNNGFKKMEPEYLVLSLESVSQGFIPLYDGEVQPDDELAVEYLLKARILRGLGRFEECNEILSKDVVNLTKYQVKNLPPLHEEWPFPSAVYEQAVLEWETNNEEDIKDNKEAMKRVKELLMRSASWGDYEMSSRIGLRIQSGLETLKDEYQI